MRSHDHLFEGVTGCVFSGEPSALGPHNVLFLQFLSVVQLVKLCIGRSIKLLIHHGAMVNGLRASQWTVLLIGNTTIQRTCPLSNPTRPCGARAHDGGHVLPFWSLGEHSHARPRYLSRVS
jgi:hypothetical protein